MATIEGSCDPTFESLKELLGEKIKTGEEVGACIVVNIDGKNVVDIWGGYMDETKAKTWQKDTITNVWSSTKTIASFACLLTHERGLLDVREPVAKYWPEFAENGKEDIRIRHIMSHTSGVSGWEDKMTTEDICNAPEAAARLAKQAPWWEPGSASGYHAATQGHLLGEIIRRATGKPMKQFVAEEIAGPLGADMQVGALEKDWPRISPNIPPESTASALAGLDPASLTIKTLTNPVLDPRATTSAVWRHADMSALNGHGNARSLNKILSAIPNGGTVDGVKLLSPKTIELIFEEQANGADVVLGIPLRFGIGYSLGGGATAQFVPWMPEGKVCFWGGWGGSMEVMDLERKVTFTYVMNKMEAGIVGNTRVKEYIELVWKILKEKDL